jgi:hypothetical protein
MKGLLVILAAIGLGIWYWRKNYKPSALDVHFADLEETAITGNYKQASSFLSQPPLAMLGEGWATAAVFNKTEPSLVYNAVLPTRYGLRFAQPSGTN